MSLCVGSVLAASFASGRGLEASRAVTAAAQSAHIPRRAALVLGDLAAIGRAAGLSPVFISLRVRVPARSQAFGSQRRHNGSDCRPQVLSDGWAVNVRACLPMRPDCTCRCMRATSAALSDALYVRAALRPWCPELESSGSRRVAARVVKRCGQRRPREQEQEHEQEQEQEQSRSTARVRQNPPANCSIAASDFGQDFSSTRRGPPRVSLAAARIRSRAWAPKRCQLRPLKGLMSGVADGTSPLEQLQHIGRLIAQHENEVSLLLTENAQLRATVQDVIMFFQSAAHR